MQVQFRTEDADLAQFSGTIFIPVQNAVGAFSNPLSVSFSVVVTSIALGVVEVLEC